MKERRSITSKVGHGLARLPRGWRIALATALLLAVAATWLQHALTPEDPTWLGIQQTGIVRVCIDPSWPPFESFNPATAQIEGLDVDLARQLAARLVPGGRAELVTVGFDSLYDALRASRCDAVLSALPYDPTRVGYVRFSIAYFNAGQVVVTRQGTTGTSTVEDLAGLVVGVEWGFVPEGDSRRRLLLQSLGLRRYPAADDVLHALQSGELDAAIVDRISVLTYQRDCPGLQIAGQPIADVNYVIPVRPDAVLLLKAIDDALLEMRTDGTLDALQDKWF